LHLLSKQKSEKGLPMLDHVLHLDTLSIAEITPPPPAEPQECWLSPGQFLAPLHHALASWHHHSHQDKNQVIIRFNNRYGAIISEYRLLEDIYEILPLRFHGPGSDDFEFYFRSHVPDLTWCSDHNEMLRVCEQISRLLPAADF
jgi:hypothetical protein